MYCTYQAELLVFWFRRSSQGARKLKIQERIVCALYAHDGAAEIARRNAVDALGQDIGGNMGGPVGLVAGKGRGRLRLGRRRRVNIGG